MNTCAAHRSLQHLGILDGIGHLRITRGLGLLQLTRTLDGIGQIHLHAIGQTVGNSLTQCIRIGQRQLLHTRHILDRVLRSHRGISDDMGTVLMSILVHHPLQHLTTTIVIEVGIDIGQ